MQEIVNSRVPRASSRVGFVLLGLVMALGAAGCGAHQRIALDIEPAPVDVYVDGELLESGDPDELELSTSRGHVVLIRRPGYRPEQVVIERVVQADEVWLSPEQIEVRLVQEGELGRKIDVSLEDEQAASGGDSAEAPGPEATSPGSGAE